MRVVDWAGRNSVWVELCCVQYLKAEAWPVDFTLLSTRYHQYQNHPKRTGQTDALAPPRYKVLGERAFFKKKKKENLFEGT